MSALHGRDYYGTSERGGGGGGRHTPNTDTMRSKKSEGSLWGTLTRKKKPAAPADAPPPQQHPAAEENEADEVEVEGRDALDSATIPELSKANVYLEEGEERRFITRESIQDGKVRDIINLLIYWTNEELASSRIVVKHIQEDFYDGQVIQKLIEKLANVKIEVPEVSQSEEGQRQKLRIVVDTVNRLIATGGQDASARPTAEQIHCKDVIAIMQLLINMALFYRAPVRFPDHVNAQALIAWKEGGKVKTRYVTEQLTTSQNELAPKGERDAFDTLFDYGPDKLAHVKSSLLAFCNKHLNKINLEVSDLETQFQDGVFLVLLMGLLEGYFVPLYHFHLQVSSQEEKLKNVSLAYRLMEDAGLPKPRSRVHDIANGDLKSTLRLLHLLFTKYKHV